jgi:small subunit ribosomal protein S6
MAQALARGAIVSVAATQNTQREYESVTILRPETAKPEIIDVIGRMQKMFGEFGATLLKIDSWGMRVLAYPIGKNRKGIYLYWRYVAGSDAVAEFERLMNLSDKCIRVHSFRVEDDVDPSARPSEVTEELLDAVSEPGPDPDELARQAAEAGAAYDPDDRDRDRDDFDNHSDDDDDDDPNVVGGV